MKEELEEEKDEQRQIREAEGVERECHLHKEGEDDKEEGMTSEWQRTVLLH